MQASGGNLASAASPPPPTRTPPPSLDVMETPRDGGELADVFCGLGCLIVEGRLPSPDSPRGFAEGPHVPSPAGIVAVGLSGAGTALLAPGGHARHDCSEDNYLVSMLHHAPYKRGEIVDRLSLPARPLSPRTPTRQRPP